MSTRLDVPIAVAAYDISTEVVALAMRNVAWLIGHPTTPELYTSGVTFLRDPQWIGIPVILARRGADCKSLTAWRLAELWRKGVNAHPRVRRIRDGLWHVTLRLPNGSEEDPSRQLGMKGDG